MSKFPLPKSLAKKTCPNCLEICDWYENKILKGHGKAIKEFGIREQALFNVLRKVFGVKIQEALDMLKKEK